MRKNWLVWAFAAVTLLVLGYAWIDGGREPTNEISQPISLPERGR
jgi:hypothetical protein